MIQRSGRIAADRRIGYPELVPGQNHYPAAVALALALGADTGVVGERHVHHPAFGRRHRFERRCATGRGDPARGPAGQVLKHVCAPLPVVLHVEDDVRLAAELAAHDHPHKELQGVERLAAAPDQQSCVRAFDFEHQRATLAFFPHIGLRMDSQCREEVVEERADGLFGLFIVFRGRLVVTRSLGPRRLPVPLRLHDGLRLFIRGFRDGLLLLLVSALPAPGHLVALPNLPALLILPALAALSALVPPAPPPSTAPAPRRAVSQLLRLRLLFVFIRAGVLNGDLRALVRNQPDFDLGRFTPEPQDAGTAGVNDGYFYVFELDAEGV